MRRELSRTNTMLILVVVVAVIALFCFFSFFLLFKNVKNFVPLCTSIRPWFLYWWYAAAKNAKGIPGTLISLLATTKGWMHSWYTQLEHTVEDLVSEKEQFLENEMNLWGSCWRFERRSPNSQHESRRTNTHIGRHPTPSRDSQSRKCYVGCQQDDDANDQSSRFYKEKCEGDTHH